jgi:hypothetical protein
MADNTPRVFTRDINGKSVERIAYTPSAAIKFVFDGWTEAPAAAAKKALDGVDRDVQAAQKAAADDQAAAKAAADKPAPKK